MVSIQGNNKIALGETKQKKLRIFCDLDGVCSWWEKAACEALDIDYDDPEIREQLKTGRKRMEDFAGGDAEMWAKIDAKGEEFWTDMPKLPWAERLYEFLNEQTNDFSFLTSPSGNPVCASGKVKWLKKYFGEKFKNFLIGKNKHLCASPDCLLVDDDDTKCEKFREYGGHVFQWPHPLKIVDGDMTEDEVFEDLKAYIEEIKK
jgi:hypothetical protein